MTSPLLDLPGAVAGDGDRRPGRRALRLVQPRAARPRGRRGLRRPLAPRGRPHRGPGPADLAALPDHPAPHRPAARRRHGGADPRPAGPRRARVRRHRRRRRRSRAHTEPGRAAALVDFLERMKFMMRVELTDVTDELAVTWRPSRGRGLRRVRARPARPADGVRRGGRSGLRASGPSRRCASRAASRGSASTPTTHDPQRGRLDRQRRAPGQGLLPRAGDRRPGAHPRPPAAPAHAAAPRRHREPASRRRRRDLLLGDKVVGFVGSSARHHELGPIALALVKRNVDVAAELIADGMPATQEVIVDPEVGLHVRRMR